MNQLSEKDPVKVGDFRRITDDFRGIYTILYLKWLKAEPEYLTEPYVIVLHVGFRITRILTDYAQKTPWALLRSSLGTTLFCLEVMWATLILKYLYYFIIYYK